eukprot:CAMPEP_0117503580 /NCGR_PEP_ID=MMETSP0784-20121206/24404_1 /TAXON_ID=39447 /ORGANISM="" /LENGTH=265 /DNA_ID=CAMNT_0005298903 /DNA_START=52 /DNA_END=846 /DNA_ORIENTATION=-
MASQRPTPAEPAAKPVAVVRRRGIGVDVPTAGPSRRHGGRVASPATSDAAVTPGRGAPARARGLPRNSTAAQRGASAPARGSRGGAEAVLRGIRDAQEGHGHVPYAKALKEIRAGRKTSHWIWYVWPCLKDLRPGTSKPHFLLPDMQAADAYLRDDVLADRLEEITTVALEHLRAGVKPRVLFGSSTDASKFAETMTIFAVAAFEAQDLPKLRLFAAALDASNGGALEARTMEFVTGVYGMPRHRGVQRVSELLERAGPRGGVAP